MSDAISDRFKTYEHASRVHLPRRMPVIIRVDGRAFHSWTRGFDRPFDTDLMEMMDRVAVALCDDIHGAQLAYVQSDEISVLLHNYKKIATQPWFENGVQKMTSIAASIASSAMTLASGRIAHFDARVFVLPESEVCNYFLWRQQDATRNSIQMLAQSLYSQKELHGKHTGLLQEMCWQKGHNWNDLPTSQRRGRCAVRARTIGFYDRTHWAIDSEIPIFSQCRDYIERHLAVDDEQVAEAAQ